MNVRGWIYVISNKAMPGLLKIGYSTKDPQLRAAELNNTGAPHPYVVVYDMIVFGPREIEQKVHSALKPQRVGKEWFKCSVEEAVAAIRRISDSACITESPFKNRGQSANTQEGEFLGPMIQVRCPSCGETNFHPDSYLVCCPLCKRTIFTREL